MPIQSLTGKDVIILDGRTLADLADGDCVTLEYANPLGTVKTGKDGNSIYAFNATGLNVRATIRLIMGSADDKWLNSRLAQWTKDPSGFVLMKGQFIKRVGDGSSSVNQVTYDVSGGIPTKIPAAKTNAEGDTEQSVVVYEITFSNGSRSIS